MNTPVVHIITGLGVGGAETMLTSLLIAKQKAGEPQHVVSLLAGGVNANRLRQAGVRVTELAMTSGRPSFWKLLWLARFIWLKRPRVLQSWMYHADLVAALAVLWAGTEAGTKLIWGLRCSDMDLGKYSLKLRLVVRTCAALSRLPQVITANSRIGADIHLNLGYTPQRLVVIDNGIDIDTFSPNSDHRIAIRRELKIDRGTQVIAHVARVDPMKDHAALFSALQRIPNVVTLLIGEGTEKLPAQANVLRLGRRDDVARLLAAADLAVSSSAFGEGFCNAVAEGMASGLPVVATNVGDAERIIGDTGAIVPPRNPAALAEAISSLLGESREQFQARGARARARIVEHFSLTRAVKEFSALHQELM